MAITFGEICTAVKTTLETTPGILKAQNYDELSEGYEDLPLLQVYPQSAMVDANSQNNDRDTFRAAGRITDVLIHADIISSQRNHLNQNTRDQVAIADAITDKLEAQKTKPLFGNALIKGFRWRWERVNFQRGDPSTNTYPGVRFFITIKVF